MAQKDKDLHIAVLGQETIERVPDSKSWVDRRVLFQITNTTEKKLFVYGARHEDGLYPLRYLLEFDAATKTWKTGKRLPWKQQSSIYKSIQVLNPSESMNFDASFSSFSDARRRYRIAAYVSFKIGKEPFEIRSDEFVVK
jgi:hypothetical protein